MAEYPAMPLWTDALMGDTSHLSTLEFGAYMKLLICAWRRRSCDLPDDDALLARYSGLTVREWKRIAPIIRPFFRRVWRHGQFRMMQKRLRKERAYVTRQSRFQSRRAKARWLKTKKTTDAGGMPSACPHTHTHNKKESKVLTDTSTEYMNLTQSPIQTYAQLPAERVSVSPPATRVKSGFEDWWQAYPRKVGKGAARKAYAKALKATTPEALADSIARFADRVQRDGTEPQYIPHPATWLNQERWTDEPEPERYSNPALQALWEDYGQPPTVADEARDIPAAEGRADSGRDPSEGFAMVVPFGRARGSR